MVGGLGVEESSKKENKIHGHEQQCADYRVLGGYNEINGNGKNTIKRYI